MGKELRGVEGFAAAVPGPRSSRARTQPREATSPTEGGYPGLSLRLRVGQTPLERGNAHSLCPSPGSEIRRNPCRQHSRKPFWKP